MSDFARKYRWHAALLTAACAIISIGVFTTGGDNRRATSAPVKNIESTEQISVNAASTAAPVSEGDEKENAGHALAIPLETLVQWIADANGGDPDKRTAAIGSLATAPKAQAVPVLQKLLHVGDTADRQHVLDALSTLAQQQGDADDEIRSTLRLVVYDGDETIASAARSTLETIEHAND